MLSSEERLPAWSRLISRKIGIFPFRGLSGFNRPILNATFVHLSRATALRRALPQALPLKPEYNKNIYYYIHLNRF